MRNTNYMPVEFAGAVAQKAVDLQNISNRMVVLTQQLTDTENEQHHYATDHANEALQHIAKQLQELATRINSLRAYTNYPPTLEQLKAGE